MEQNFSHLAACPRYLIVSILIQDSLNVQTADVVVEHKTWWSYGLCYYTSSCICLMESLRLIIFWCLFLPKRHQTMTKWSLIVPLFWLFCVCFCDKNTKISWNLGVQYSHSILNCVIILISFWFQFMRFCWFSDSHIQNASDKNWLRGQTG